ncbi:GNAT family N-acetyltransferase [Arcobacter sp. KX21116]|uniref:GNAT family N-acetyltransferase n=1 Tax=Arcobacter iocasae TaxID=2906515 RepID=UPI0035D45F7D
MSIEIIEFDNIDKNKLEYFFNQSLDIWFQHSTNWIEYTLNMRKEGSKNLSFAIIENNEIVAFAPLIKEYIFFEKEKNEFNMAGIPTLYPAFSSNLSKNNRDKIEKLVFQKIFEISESEKIDYMTFGISPLIDNILNTKIIVNPLIKYKFQDTTISSNILKLDKEEDVLFRNFRKGTKSDIKVAIKNGASTKVYNSENITKELFMIYKDIHFKASGRQTRPDETWGNMYNWILNNYSILALTTIKDKIISAQIVNVYKSKAYYHSGATLPEYEKERGIGHLAQWEIIKYLKSNDFTHYEIGWNWYPNVSQEVADNKMQGISRFKSGFGADIFPFFRGEWFRDKEYMKKIINERLDKYEI